MRNLFLNKTPSQPLSMPRSERFVPPSRYYGDRFPRTLQEAFGPHAELHIERRAFLDKYLGYVVAVGVGLLIGLASWLVQNYPAG